MIKKVPRYLLTFFNTSGAIAVERFCKERGIPGRLIPVPREISASCGLSWRFCRKKRTALNWWNVNLQKKSKESGCWMSEIRKEWKTMKEYEVIWEIFNKCPRNQMRDVFVEEVELADPEEYVRHKFQGKDVSYDKTVLPDGTIVFDIVTSQIKQRCSFTEI